MSNLSVLGYCLLILLILGVIVILLTCVDFGNIANGLTVPLSNL